MGQCGGGGGDANKYYVYTTLLLNFNSYFYLSLFSFMLNQTKIQFCVADKMHIFCLTKLFLHSIYHCTHFVDFEFVDFVANTKKNELVPRDIISSSN